MRQPRGERPAGIVEVWLRDVGGAEIEEASDVAIVKLWARPSDDENAPLYRYSHIL